MRGKRQGRGDLRRRPGFIPAHAGKTTDHRQTRVVVGVHPRACGENYIFHAMRARDEGSSPRMRGKLFHVPSLRSKYRFIPAHAGKTSTSPTRSAASRVHPRACGENDAEPLRPSGLLGSSPRMRGKLARHGHEDGLVRFIPAHAGKTGPALVICSVRAVHPRACGENIDMRILELLARGSSPRMRGKLAEGGDEHVEGRFIPAHAGKTPSVLPRPYRLPVHPRACGENHRRSARNGIAGGSSPRMRGKRSTTSCSTPSRRFIPAHAGKT